MNQASGANNRGFVTSWSIRRKLTLLLMVVFIPASAIVVASGVDQRGHEMEEAEETALLIVQVLTAYQEQIATGIGQMLHGLALLPEVRRLDADGCERLFRELRARYPTYSILAATTADGTVIAASPALDPGRAGPFGAKGIRNAVDTVEFSAGDFTPETAGGLPAIHYAQPVSDDSGNLAAIVIAGFNLNESIRVLERVGFDDRYGITIADREGRILYQSPRNAPLEPGTRIPEEMFRRMQSDTAGSTFSAPDEKGVVRLYAARQLRIRENSSPYLYFIADMTHSRMIEYANRKVMAVTLGIALVAFVAVCLAWVFGNFVFVRPIGRLSRAAGKFGKGEFNVRTDLPHTPDELGELARSFDEMASLVELRNTELRRSEAELLHHREHLEELVKERTARLGTLNAQLEEEIAERRRAEQRIQASLEEKEILLREIHHRVKNNLQTISSLISLQSKYTTDERFLDVSRESQNRIRSMLLVHEKLYRSDDLSKVDFLEYLRSLANSLFRSYSPDAVALQVEGERVFLGVDTAIPCALLVNELLSNSLKHAFPGGMRGMISIALHSGDDGKLELTVGDDGVGLPAGMDFRLCESLGTQLVHTLAHQLKADFEPRPGPGTNFKITFAELRYRGESI